MNHPVFKIRTANKMTLVETSNSSGVSVGTLSKIENRKRVARIGTLKKLATCFGVDWRELVED